MLAESITISAFVMTNTSIPDWLTGVWRRLSIETEDGHRDTTTQVFWLQTHHCFADIRIPANRPDYRHAASVTDLTLPDAIALSHQQGFAGITHLQDSTCQWQRYIDYQPPNGSRDIGTLYWESDILIEEGVDAVYREEWQRLDNSQDNFTALVLPAIASPLQDHTSWRGCLVTAGDYFIYAWNRLQPIPPAASLNALLQDPALSLQKQATYLECELSLGLCQSGAVPWEIQLSTLPWKEGRSLWSPADLTINVDQGTVTQQPSEPQGEAHHWIIQEWSHASSFEQR